MLGALVIILREVLEASMVISLMLALLPKVPYGRTWLAAGILVGTMLAILIALQIDVISIGLEGMGLEFLNAITLTVSSMTLILLVLGTSAIANNYRKYRPSKAGIAFLATTAVSISLSVELSEILIYWYEQIFIAKGDSKSLIAGTIIGAGIGASCGFLIYVFLVATSRRLMLSQILMSIVAAGFMSQAVSWLQQADWISDPGAAISFDAIISEQSLAGQMLNALIGYESSPSIYQLAVYVVVIGITLPGLILQIRSPEQYKQLHSEGT